MAYDICVDHSGNNFTTGYFSSGMNLDGTVINASGITDMFLVKSDPNGGVQWAVKGGGNNITEGLAVCTDHQGNVIVGGFFYGTATFGTQTLTATGSKDGFVAKYDNLGNFLWATKVEGTLLESVNKVTTDANNNILITGEFSSSNFAIGSSTLSSPNNSLDVFVAKLSPFGSVQWLKSGTAPLIDRGTQIACDNNGDVYVGGEFSDTITFDAVHYNTMYNAVFVIKYSSGGQEQWFRYMGSGSTVNMKGLKCDQSNNIIALENYTSSLIYFDFGSSLTLTNNYPNNYSLSSISSAGALNWKITDGSSSPVFGECLAISSSGELAVGGTYDCKFNDFADQYGQGVFCSIGYEDGFVSRYSGSGNWIASRCFGGNKSDFLYGIAYDNLGIPIIAGGFEKIIYFPSAFGSVLGYGHEVAGINHDNCSEFHYYNNYYFSNSGNTDVYYGRAINFLKLPMDIFEREPLGCDLTFPELCIDQCQDTIFACGKASLLANMHQQEYYTPDYAFLWNTGDTAHVIQVTTSGIYSVIMTTPDGCFTDTDSVVVVIHPTPAIPLITDSKGVNFQALNPVPVRYCYPDSVLLTSTVPPFVMILFQIRFGALCTAFHKSR
ncbi:MAG: hypothetical protein IPP51_13425 [Bacteroidetes bacterium]|nr:hypothetical protein [Bacteroidota bacterium]